MDRMTGLKLRWFVAGVALTLGAVVLWSGTASRSQETSRPGAPTGLWRPTPAEAPRDGKLRIIAFGAHPDDCELKVAGAAARWAALGHHVKFVSVTNGDIGHWGMAGGPLARRRND